MRRIQYWTSEELLDPIDCRHTGRGTVRRYPASALLQGAILWEMSERNMSPKQMREVRATIAFQEPEEGPSPYDVALKGDRRVLLLVDLSDPTTVRAVIDPERRIAPADWPVGLWIDLTATFARLRPYFS